MTTNFKKISDDAAKGGFLSSKRGGRWKAIAISALFAIGLAALSTPVAAQTSRIASTKHNLSLSGPGPVKATSETQVCVFCHTPHAATLTGQAPLWNRTASVQTYTRYTSSSLDANTITDGFSAQPGGSSLLCLSCHDGMIALGNVNVLPRNTGTPVGGPIAGTDVTMPVGSGVLTGFTRNLGTDLSNDHPISITYNDALAALDGEMARLTTAAPAQRDVNTAGALIGIRAIGYKPLLPLEPTGTGNLGQVQCATCHDPHTTKDRFLRLNRFQTTAAPTATFNQANDQICLACHTKLGLSWGQSAHANIADGAYVYKDDASLVRGFPRPSDAGAPALRRVWEVACLNCHDTHTASGSRRLLREGVGTAPSTTSASFQAGSATRPLENVSSIENTCYQCHTTPTISILTVPTMTATTGVPNIFTEFARTIRMPIRTAEQFGTGNTNTDEVHDITDADFMETQLKLGRGATSNRHVECTDCHNPHRVIKNALFNGLGAATQRTHVAGGTAALLGADGNIASGALRGTWGVEPSYTAAGQTTVTASTIWPELPTFVVKKGDPGVSTSTARTATYLTREYQLCFKCHSNYANSDLASGFPVLGNTGGGTPSGTNGMLRYTNVAAEFAVRATDPPTTGTDQGEGTNVSTVCGGADCVPAGTSWDTNTPLASTLNHRSWHPVVFPTGRSGLERGSATFDNIRPPFNVAARQGLQTMQCSDCHGMGTSWTDGTGPNLAQAQGPHGSTDNFLLKGRWGTTSTLGNLTSNTTELCANCHLGTGSSQSGYNGVHDSGGNMAGSRCMRCHVAVPHGWKNKAFLVNKRCVGTEGGQATNCVALANAYTTDLNAAPYYSGARLYFATWRRSRDAGYNSETSTCSGSGDMTSCAIP